MTREDRLAIGAASKAWCQARGLKARWLAMAVGVSTGQVQSWWKRQHTSPPKPEAAQRIRRVMASDLDGEPIPVDERAALVAELRDVIAAGRFTCAEVADELGLTEPSVAGWVKGQRRPSHRAAVDLRALLRSLEPGVDLASVDLVGELAAWRRAVGLSVRRLSHLSGIDCATLRRLEEGPGYTPRVATLRKLREARASQVAMLRDWMADDDISADTVADVLGVGLDAFEAWTSGRALPNPEQAGAIARLLEDEEEDEP